MTSWKLCCQWIRKLERFGPSITGTGTLDARNATVTLGGSLDGGTLKLTDAAITNFANNSGTLDIYGNVTAGGINNYAVLNLGSNSVLTMDAGSVLTNGASASITGTGILDARNATATLNGLLDGATLKLADTASGNLGFNSGTLDIYGNTAITMGSGTAVVNTLNLALAGTGILDARNATATLNGVLDGATLKLADTASGNLGFNSGTLDIYGNVAITMGAGTAAVNTLNLALAGTGILDARNATATLSGSLEGGQLKTGAATINNFTLNSGNWISSGAMQVPTTKTLTINGGTFTNNGTLQVPGTLQVKGGLLDGSGATTVSSGGYFDWFGGTLGGTQTITVQTGANFNPDISGGGSGLLVVDGSTLDVYPDFALSGSESSYDLATQGFHIRSGNVIFRSGVRGLLLRRMR